MSYIAFVAPNKLLRYLVSYDCVTFNSCLETILAENTRLQENPYHQQSPWLFMEAANTIISVSKAIVLMHRVYRVNASFSLL